VGTLKKSQSLPADVLKNSVAGEHRLAPAVVATAREFASCVLFMTPLLLKPIRYKTGLEFAADVG
jgi:hypothetical protein